MRAYDDQEYLDENVNPVGSEKYINEGKDHVCVFKKIDLITEKCIHCGLKRKIKYNA